MALGTGFFQFLMPIVGALFTSCIYNLIQTYAKYLAAMIFIIIGLKMYFENKTEKSEYCSKNIIVEIPIKTILLLSVATSIDALAAGISLFLIEVPIISTASFIGIVTFAISLIGFVLGKTFKKIAPEIICKLAGAILIILGLKSIFL